MPLSLFLSLEIGGIMVVSIFVASYCLASEDHNKKNLVIGLTFLRWALFANCLIRDSSPLIIV